MASASVELQTPQYAIDWSSVPSNDGWHDEAAVAFSTGCASIGPAPGSAMAPQGMPEVPASDWWPEDAAIGEGTSMHFVLKGRDTVLTVMTVATEGGLSDESNHWRGLHLGLMQPEYFGERPSTAGAAYSNTTEADIFMPIFGKS